MKSFVEYLALIYIGSFLTTGSAENIDFSDSIHAACGLNKTCEALLTTLMDMKCDQAGYYYSGMFAETIYAGIDFNKMPGIFHVCANIGYRSEMFVIMSQMMANPPFNTRCDQSFQNEYFRLMDAALNGGGNPALNLVVCLVAAAEMQLAYFEQNGYKSTRPTQRLKCPGFNLQDDSDVEDMEVEDQSKDIYKMNIAKVAYAAALPSNKGPPPSNIKVVPSFSGNMLFIQPNKPSDYSIHPSFTPKMKEEPFQSRGCGSVTFNAAVFALKFLNRLY